MCLNFFSPVVKNISYTIQKECLMIMEDNKENIKSEEVGTTLNASFNYIVFLNKKCFPYCPYHLKIKMLKF